MHTKIVGIAIAAFFLVASSASAASAGDKEVPCAENSAASGPRTDIKDLAGICTGEILLLFHQDGFSGRAFASLVTGGTHSIGTSAEVTATIAQLRILADADSSGEASVEELNSLADLIILGILETQLATTYGSDRMVVLAATGLNEAELAAKESAYRKLESRAQVLGFKLPGGLHVGR